MCVAFSSQLIIEEQLQQILEAEATVFQLGGSLGARPVRPHSSGVPAVRRASRADACSHARPRVFLSSFLLIPAVLHVRRRAAPALLQFEARAGRCRGARGAMLARAPLAPGTARSIRLVLRALARASRRIQPNQETREKQLSLWQALVLSYCQDNKVRLRSDSKI